jgi:surfactin synthase thioesterase subunit
MFIWIKSTDWRGRETLVGISVNGLEQLAGEVGADGERRSGQPRIYCFTHAGGGAGEFSGWSDRRCRVTFVPVHLPGRGPRFGESGETDVRRLADKLGAELDVSAPYGLFGHSFGALIAFEVARSVRRSGRRPPVNLWLSAFPAPDRYEPDLEPFHLLPDAALLEHLNSRLQAIPDEVFEYPELMAMVAGNLRNDYRALAAYRLEQEPALDCETFLLAGSEDSVTVEEMFAWRRQVRVHEPAITFGGDHFYLRERVNRERLVELMSQSF